MPKASNNLVLVFLCKDASVFRIGRSDGEYRKYSNVTDGSARNLFPIRVHQDLSVSPSEVPKKQMNVALSINSTHASSVRVP